MSSHPPVSSSVPDPVPGPDTPEPNLPPTPGPDTPPEPLQPPGFPPLSPLSPAIDASPATPRALTEETAYPEPPPHYEQSPLTPPARAEGVNLAHPTHQEPQYQPSGIASAVGAETAQAAEGAYPEAPKAYEQDERSAASAPEASPPPAEAPSATESGAERGPVKSSSKTPLIVTSSVILMVLAMVCGGAWYFFHAGGHVITAGGELAATAAGLHYENGHERIAFTAPGTWSRFPASTAQVMVRGDGCSFGLLEQRTLLSTQQLAEAEAKDLHRRHPEAAPIITPRLVAGHEGLAFSGSYTDSEGQPMTQTYILVDRGSNLLTLIETGTSTACPAAFLSLEDSLRI